MPQDSIAEQLKNNRRWHFIPGKSKILSVLESVLKDNEYIIDVIDGFFPDAGKKSGKANDSGLILVTDINILLIRSEHPDNHVLIKKEKIKSIRCEKNFSSVTVKIELAAEKFSFVTHLSEFAVKNIFSASGKTVEKEGRAPAIAPAVTESLPESEDSIESVHHNAGSGLLLSEIKKMKRKLDEFREVFHDNEFTRMFADDLIRLSMLCGINQHQVSDNEALFIYMSLSAGGAYKDADNEKIYNEVVRYDSFPQYLKDGVNRQIDEIISLVKKAEETEDRRLKTLGFLARYDKEYDTKYSDRMASLFYEYSQCLLKADGIIDGNEEEKLKKISEIIHNSKQPENAEVVDPNERTGEETIDQVMEKINELVGMENIKEEIRSFVNFVSIRNEREKRKLPVIPLSLHAVFYGPPGTGKTTIARLLGRVYRSLGLLKIGHLVETDRAGLVAGYVGQTAIKTDELVTRAKDGVLFIDEAYTLVPGNGTSDFGSESVDTILKRMEDLREGFAVIAAGYTDEMERFINSNPGLKSRFSRYYYFNHYTPDELMQIFDIFAKNVEFSLNDDARIELKELITHFYNLRSKSFGNARFIRNVFDRIVQNQADRLASVSELTDEILCGVTVEDIPRKEDFTAEQFA